MDFLITEDDCINLGFFCVEHPIAGLKQRRYRRYPQSQVVINVIYLYNSDNELLASWVEMIVISKMIIIPIQTVDELITLYNLFKETILTT